MSTPAEIPPHVAVVGMAARLPGARDVDEFWRNLREGRESIAFLSEEEVVAAGVSPALAGHPAYVRAHGVLDDADRFDAAFFDFTPRDAALMDPQLRVALECAWEALERAGHDPGRFGGAVGVYAGAGTNSHLLHHLLADPGLLQAVGGLQMKLVNSSDFLPTWISYKLNLHGPSVNVQTACSTSLVAVHLACQGLLNGECDLALAGGFTLQTPQKAGYLYQEGSIASPDGHCRAFDADAGGAVAGSGGGFVVLRRLEDALADGDFVHAVIRGSAINNDGARKIGFTAPSVDGQAAAIAEAHAIAGVDPETITCVEAHGTGTALGDPVEIAALTQVFRASTEKKGFCAVGSVKTNLGHLDTGAGVAGLIKTVLALQHGEIPPSLHYRTPNPQIDFAGSPFFVNAELRRWERNGTPRRAGVSSFGMGGTNAHVVLEEAPAPAAPPAPARGRELLVLSARTETALEAATANLAGYLETHPEANLADVAWTLQAGRRVFAHRRALVCADAADALAALRPGSGRAPTLRETARDRRTAFLFPGQGTQYPGMARGLYAGEPVFRQEVDRCAAILRPHLGLDLRDVLFSAPGDAGAAERLRQTWLAQPALFAVEYALAKLWTSWTGEPRAMLGHSIGEYVAACVAEVLSLEDALALVALRGRLVQALPPGAMLSVSLPEAELRQELGDGLDLAAVNGPALCVASGTADAVARLEERLAARGVPCRRLHTSHAFHSAMMNAAVAPFAAEVARVALRAPRIPFLSNVTGGWITEAEATDPAYWARHLRATVRFAGGLGELLKDPGLLLVEAGPGRVLGSLAHRHPGWSPERAVVPLLPAAGDDTPEGALALEALGRAWLAGVEVRWEALHPGGRRRVPLPTYPFEGERHSLGRTAPPGAAVRTAEPDAGAAAETPPPAGPSGRRTLATPYEAPRDELERALAEIWAESLGIGEIGIHDNFFELGGNSLLATEILSRMRSSLRVKVPVRALLGAQTIAALAQVIHTRKGAVP